MSDQTDSATVSVLWITAEAPDRSLGGGSIRQSHLLQGLAGRAAVDLLAVGVEPDEHVRAAVRRVIAVPLAAAPPPAGPARRRLRALAGALLPGGPSERRDNGPARAALLAALRTREHYDVVLVEHAGLGDLVAARRPGERWLLTLHNIPSLSAEQAGVHARGARQRWTWRRERAQALRLERDLLARYDDVVTVSASDAAALPGPARVVPNGVDLTHFGPSPLPGEPRLVFTGTLDFLPNVDGLEWFMAQVWPLIRSALPAVTLDIVGRHPTPEVVRLAAEPAVDLHADVPDVAPYLHRARVAVVPLRQGSGTRLKALEALAVGRPLVGTSVGLAGLSLVDGVEALVRDDPAALAAGICEVLGSPLGEQLAERGPAVAQRFGWPVSVAVLVELVHD